jgi:hypothetical protein
MNGSGRWKTENRKKEVNGSKLKFQSKSLESLNLGGGQALLARASQIV